MWKEIPGTQGIYSISDSGEVKNNRTDKTIKQSFYKNGYLGVGIVINGKQKRYRVHRLVAMTFLENPEKKTQVNHKDGNKTNNSVSNLEWATPQENMRHAYANGLKEINYSQKGYKNPKAVIQCDLNGNEIRRYKSIKDAERITGIDNSGIAKACKGIYKTQKGFKWRYAT